MRFVSESVSASVDTYDATGLSRGEPVVPASFAWHDETLVVDRVLRTWRSTKTDRGDAYLKRHWYETALRDGRTAVFYFDRGARKDTPRWWLYTIDG